MSPPRLFRLRRDEVLLLLRREGLSGGLSLESLTANLLVLACQSARAFLTEGESEEKAGAPKDPGPPMSCSLANPVCRFSEGESEGLPRYGPRRSRLLWLL
jgi:hypothetical protein